VKKARRLLWLLAALPVAGLVFLGVQPAALLQRLGPAHVGPVNDWLSAGLQLAYGAPAEPPAAAGERVRIAISERPLRTLDVRFLSVAIDTSQLLGGRWWSAAGKVEVGRGSERVPPLDLSRPGLASLARALAPAYLRIGGTEADRVAYAFGGVARAGELAQNELTLDAARWDALHEFSAAAGLDLYFTINAGPGARGAEGEWLRSSAEGLLAHARAQRQGVSVWELGNEVNAYWFQHSLREQPSGAQYAADLLEFRALVKEYFPQARVAGPAVAYFPLLGDPLPERLGFLPAALEHGGRALDILSWHFYPQQSRRCPVATRRARAGQLLGPVELDEMQRWSQQLEELRARWAPGAELWLGETGHAQCGGEPGLSDRFASGLWWLDELGLAARAGQAVVIRQALIGSDYGLLDARTLEPRPDYYNSLAWKHWMGSRVLGVELSSGNPALRAYAHCSAQEGEAAVLLVLNVDPVHAAEFQLQGAVERMVRFDFSAPRLDSKELFVNGERLVLDAGARAVAWPELRGRAANPGEPVLVPAASYGFFELSGPVAAPCHSTEPSPSSAVSTGSAAG
jgi:heparanase 1